MFCRAVGHHTVWTPTARVAAMALDREAFRTLLGPLRALLDYNLNMRVLKSIKLFQKLTEQEKDLLVKSFSHQPFHAGATMIKQDDEGDKFYIIKEGSAKVLQRLDNDYQEVKEVAELSTGDYFGEMALLNNEVRKATVVAVTDVETFYVDRSVFNRGLGECFWSLVRRTLLQGIKRPLLAAQVRFKRFWIATKPAEFRP